MLNTANVLGVRMNEQKGVIKKYFTDRRFGFIESDSGKDFFFHYSSIANDAEPIEGRRATFVSKETDKGLAAIRVIVEVNQEQVRHHISSEIDIEVNGIKVYSRTLLPAYADVKLSKNLITIKAKTGFIFWGSEHVITRRLTVLHSVEVERGFTGFTQVRLFGGGPPVTLERQSMFGNANFNKLAENLENFMASRQ